MDGLEGGRNAGNHRFWRWCSTLRPSAQPESGNCSPSPPPTSWQAPAACHCAGHPLPQRHLEPLGCLVRDWVVRDGRGRPSWCYVNEAGKALVWLDETEHGADDLGAACGGRHDNSGLSRSRSPDTLSLFNETRVPTLQCSPSSSQRRGRRHRFLPFLRFEFRGAQIFYPVELVLPFVLFPPNTTQRRGRLDQLLVI